MSKRSNLIRRFDVDPCSTFLIVLFLRPALGQKRRGGRSIEAILVGEKSNNKTVKRTLLPNNLHQNALAPSSVKLAVEDLFPGAEVQLSASDRDDHFASHDLAFYMRVGIVLAGIVVPVLFCRFMRRQLFEPNFVIM